MKRPKRVVAIPPGEEPSVVERYGREPRRPILRLKRAQETPQLTTKGIDAIAPFITREDLSRRFMIHVCKDGTVSYRDRDANEPVFNGVALPVLSVDTEQQARDIQVRFCRLQIKRHPQMRGRPWYRLSGLPDGTDLAFRPSGCLEIEDLAPIGAMFKDYLERVLLCSSSK